MRMRRIKCCAFCKLHTTIVCIVVPILSSCFLLCCCCYYYYFVSLESSSKYRNMESKLRQKPNLSSSKNNSARAWNTKEQKHDKSNSNQIECIQSLICGLNGFEWNERIETNTGTNEAEFDCIDINDMHHRLCWIPNSRILMKIIHCSAECSKQAEYVK